MTILTAVLFLKRRLLKIENHLFCELVETITQNLEMGNDLKFVMAFHDR